MLRFSPRLLKWLAISGILVVLLLITLSVVARHFIEPTLRKRLHALIVEGSNGLYTYQLGSLHTSLFSGTMEVQDFHMQLDSNRYYQLQQQNDLPPVTVQIALQKAAINGLDVVSFLLSKKINIEEIRTEALNLRVMRQSRPKEANKEKPPFWKAVQPSIRRIAVRRIVLDSIKFLLKSNDTATAMKLQFDRFDARLDNLLIDSSTAQDPARTLFAQDVFLRWHDLKFRNADSTYKFKAEWITYSSHNNVVEVDSFKLQPTMQPSVFYERLGRQQSLYYLTFDRIRITGFDLARLIHQDAFVADSFLVRHPRLSVYLDKTWPRTFASREGSLPHQRLRNLSTRFHCNQVSLLDGQVLYTEKNGKTLQDGRLLLEHVNMRMHNLTNDSLAIRKNGRWTVQTDGLLMGSPLRTDFTFYLDSTNARFDVKGSVRDLTAARLNQLSVPMANIYLPSLQIHSLDFFIRGTEWTTYSDVRMRYNNLSLVWRQLNENGANETRGFFTKVINKTVHPHNPEPNGVERTATNVRFQRLTTQAFFGVIWKSLFAGMQEVMMRK